MDLFRKEAVEHATRRLAGDVVLKSPISVQALTAVVMVVTLGAFAFASAASYSRRETATGWIVPTGGLIRVLARENGSIEALRVTEGASVAAGTRIAQIKLASELETGNSGLVTSRAIAAELTAANSQITAAKSAFKAKRAQLLAQSAHLEREILESKRHLSIILQRQLISEGQVRRGETLRANGFISVQSFELLRSALLLSQQEASDARANILDLEGQAGDLRRQLITLAPDMQVQTAQAEQNVASVLERSAASDAQSHVLLVSPIDARVLALPTEVGQAVAPGTPVAILVPTGSVLIAELYLPSKSIGFVAVGQEVRLMYDAFPYQVFGTGNARIISISNTVFLPGDLSLPAPAKEPMFRVRAEIESPLVSAYGKRIPLQPGMSLKAEIVVDRRNLLQWLMDPLYAVGKRA